MSSVAFAGPVLSPQSRQALFTRPAFRGLGEEERARIVGLFQETSLAKGETVYQAGDEADALYLVVAGAVDIVDGTRSVARYGPGEIFGEAVLVPGERRAVTTRVALDAVLVFLTRESLARLLELHPSLYERVPALLAGRLKQAARIVSDGARPPSEIVVLQGWTSAAERRAFVGLLAQAIEAELGRRVSIVTVASPGETSAAAVRGDRPDAIVAAGVHERGTLRDRLATELATRGEQAPVVLLDLDGDLDGPGPSLSLLADTVLVRMDGQPTGHWDTDSRRIAFVQDERTQPRVALSSNKIFTLPTNADGRARALGRLARYLTRRSVGLALGSGAAWGLSHIGVLDVFEREHIPVDVIAGASMGAIVGAHYALGFSPARLTEIATSVQRVTDYVRILPQLLYLAVDFNIARPGMFAGEHFQRVLESMGPITGRTFADLETPFRAVATDITTGARVELGDGNLSDAIRASFSAPWIFSPFRIGKHILVDGGMSDPVPAETVRTMGADLVIGVNVVPPVYPSAQSPLEAALRLFTPSTLVESGSDSRLPSSFDVVVRILQIMQHELGNDRTGELDVLVNPDLREFWVMQFWSAAGIIEQGRRAAEAALPTIRAKLDQLHKEGP